MNYPIIKKCKQLFLLTLPKLHNPLIRRLVIAASTFVQPIRPGAALASCGREQPRGRRSKPELIIERIAIRLRQECARRRAKGLLLSEESRRRRRRRQRGRTSPSNNSPSDGRSNGRGRGRRSTARERLGHHEGRCTSSSGAETGCRGRGCWKDIGKRARCGMDGN